MNPRIVRYDALAAVDGAGFAASPASLLVDLGNDDPGGLPRLLAAGRPEEVSGHPGAVSAVAFPLPDSVLMPGLVNAHTHLDLTHLGPRPFDAGGGFVQWVEMIRTERETGDDLIAASVRRGI